MKLWVVTGKSESGDHYGPDTFATKPTPEELSEWCHGNDGHFGDAEDYDAGPGYDGSYVYPEVKEATA